MIARCLCNTQPFHLPTLDGLHLVEGLCDGVFLGIDALAGFPSLKTLPYMAMLGYHGVNVFQSDSRNKSMVIHIRNTWEEKKIADVAREVIGNRTFVNWPFLQEGLVVAVSDDMFRYEKLNTTPHSPHMLNRWKSKAESIEHRYSKRFAVQTGNIDILLHVQPLKGKEYLNRASVASLMNLLQVFAGSKTALSSRTTILHLRRRLNKLYKCLS